MKIIPGNTPVVLDGKELRQVLSVELSTQLTAGPRPEVYAIITVRLDHAETGFSKIELSSYTE